MAIAFEDFAASSPVIDGIRAPLAGSQDETEAEAAQRTAIYEQGYKAGWDDAARAESEAQTRIGAEFARNLQELSFTFHEARAHVIQSMEPLLEEVTGALLPALVAETLGARILEELRPLIENAADAPVELLVAPASRPAVERHVAEFDARAVTIREEPSLAEGQAYFRVGKAERRVDLTEALEHIREAIRTLYSLNERTLKHA